MTTEPINLDAIEARHGDELRDELAATLILHDHPERNSLTRPEDPLVMLRTDPSFHVCATALARAEALLPIVTEHLAKSFREGYEAGSAQAEEDIERRIAQARVDALQTSNAQWSGLVERIAELEWSLAQARAETAEQIAVAIEPRGTRSTHMIYLHAARIARQHAQAPTRGDAQGRVDRSRPVAADRRAPAAQKQVPVSPPTEGETPGAEPRLGTGAPLHVEEVGRDG